MAIIHKCNYGLFEKQKILQGNNGWSIVVHANKKFQIAKLEDLLKALLKNGLRYSQRNVSFLEKNYNIWGIQYSLRIGDYALNHCKVG